MKKEETDYVPFFNRTLFLLFKQGAVRFRLALALPRLMFED